MLKAIDESIELAKRFENVLTRIQYEIPFNPEWRSNSSSSSYEGAVSLKLEAGKVAKSIDTDNGRRLILVGTDLDTVVVFERYTPNKTQSFSLLYNSNAALDFLLGGSYLSIAQFSLVVTDYDISRNIGGSLENLFNRMARRKPVHDTHEPVSVPKL